MIIHITNLRLRAIVGTEDHERENKQDVVVNVKLEFDGAGAARSDDLAQTVNYKALAERIGRTVEGSSCHLLEKLADKCLEIVMSDERVSSAEVRIDKPGALPAADSVSVTCSARRQE